MAEWEFLIMIGTLIVGGLSWLLKLENRISSHELVCAERQKNLMERNDAMIARVSALDGKMDALVAHLMGPHRGGTTS